MKNVFLHKGSMLTLLLAATSTTAAPIVVEDFESGNFDKWEVTGDAFKAGAVRRDPDAKDQRLSTSMNGEFAVHSGAKGSHLSGTISSPAFTIDRDFLTFRIAGGISKDTRVEVLVDDKVVKECSGIENYRLKPNYFDLRQWRGKTAQIRIVDEVSEGFWGHIAADHFVLTDKKPDFAPWKLHERTFTITDDYLVVPVRNTSDKERAILSKKKDWLEIGGSPVQLFVDGKMVRDFKVVVAESEEAADWFGYLYLDEFKGKEATVRAWRASEEGFSALKQSGKIPGEETFYKEAFRPQFHFTQKTGFSNDPNGMVYHNGIWHYFWQHNPFKKDMGNQTWGHATSPDLLHWTQHKGALFPHINGDGRMYSGGGTVDTLNTSGFGKDAMVLFFTNTGIGECIAYSTDNGKSFQRYEGNPVITFDKKDTSGKPIHQGRDPKVIWYEYDEKDTPLNELAKKQGGHWVMLVYDFTEGNDRKGGAFYTSVNMKNWERQSLVPGYFECMEVFELPVDGDASNSRWVVFGGDAKYAVGDFDGKIFTAEHEGKHQLHHGSYYASQTFDNAPNGRRIQMGWMTINGADEAPYTKHHSFPHQLTLHQDDDGIRMYANPIEEIEQLRIKSAKMENQIIDPAKPISLPFTSNTLDVTAEIEIGDAKEITLHIPGTHITYKVEKEMIQNREIPLKAQNGKITLRVLVDVNLYELIGNDGQIYASFGRDYKLDINEIRVVAHGGKAKLIRLEAHDLKSVWREK